MADILVDDKVLLFKKETTYATDPTPTGAANAVQTTEFAIQPLEMTAVPRNLDKPGQGASPDVMTMANVPFSFKIEASGGGAAGDPPPYEDVILAAGFAATVDVGVSVTYDPVSVDPDSGTAYFYQGPHLHKALGARGAMGFELEVGKMPYFTFDYRALYAAIAAGAPTGVDYSGYRVPSPVEDANTPTFTLFGYAALLQKLSIGGGRTPSYRNLVGQEAIRLGPRRITGQATIVAPGIAAKDYYAAMKAGTLGALSCIHDSAAGDIVEVAAAAVQITSIRHIDIDGDLGLDLGLLFTETDGDDEVAYIVR